MIHPHPDGAILDVWVVPGASRTAVAGRHGEALKVRVTSPPERGRANAELADYLGEILGARVAVRPGRSRRKQVVVAATPAQVRRMLDRHLPD